MAYGLSNYRLNVKDLWFKKPSSRLTFGFNISRLTQLIPSSFWVYLAQCFIITRNKYITWQGCYWGRLAEIPDSLAAVCLCSLILTPGCTSWLIWSPPSGLGPNQQTQTHTAGKQIQNRLFSCYYICLLTGYNWYYFHKRAQLQGSEGNSQAQFESLICFIKGIVCRISLLIGLFHS